MLKCVSPDKLKPSHDMHHLVTDGGQLKACHACQLTGLEHAAVAGSEGCRHLPLRGRK